MGTSSKTYRIYFKRNKASAKYKATVSATRFVGCGPAFNIVASSEARAWEYLCRLIVPNDNRPVIGRRQLREAVVPTDDASL